MSALYRIVYASKNLLGGTEAETRAEVEQILAASRRNNARAGVSGALMFNNGAFAQVLEGPQRGVEETFERIQRDTRHGEVTVLECGPVAARGFVAWSMAFVGQSVRGRAMWSGLAAESGFDLARLDGDAVFAMLHGLVLEEEAVAVDPPIAADTSEITSDRVPCPMDATRVRAEVARLMPPGAAVVERAAGDTSRADGGGVVALAILKAALADERGRTSELRGTVDDLQLALAECRADLDALRAQRDRWVQRARLLAAVLCDEAPEIRNARDDGAPLAGERKTGRNAAPKRAVA